MNKNRFLVILTTPSHSYPPWPTIMLIFRNWDETDLGDAHFCFLGLLRGVSILFYALCFLIFNICLLYCLALIKLCCHLKKKKLILFEVFFKSMCFWACIMHVVGSWDQWIWWAPPRTDHNPKFRKFFRCYLIAWNWIIHGKLGSNGGTSKQWRVNIRLTGWCLGIYFSTPFNFKGKIILDLQLCFFNLNLF